MLDEKLKAKMEIYDDKITKSFSSGLRHRKEFSVKSRKALAPRNTPTTKNTEDFGKKKSNNAKTAIIKGEASQENLNKEEQYSVQKRIRNGKKMSVDQELSIPTVRPPSMLLRLQSRHATTTTSLLRQPAVRVPMKTKTSPNSKATPESTGKQSVEIEANSMADTSSLQVSFGRNTALRLEDELANEVGSECSFSSCLASDEGSNHEVSISKANKESSFLTCLAMDDTATVNHDSSYAEKIKVVEESTNYNAQECVVSSVSRGGVMMDLSPLFSPSPEKMSAARRNFRAAITPEGKKEGGLLVPTLSLTSFQEVVWLDFGDEKKNTVGKTRLLYVVLSATQEKGQEKSEVNLMNGDIFHVEVERIPAKKGISLYLYDEGMSVANLSMSEPISSIDIKKGVSKRCIVSWTPVEAGGIRENIHLKLPRGRLIITVNGRARDLSPNKSGSKKKTRDSSNGRIKVTSSSSIEQKCRNPPFQAKKDDYLTPFPKKLHALPLQSIISPLKETPKEVSDVVWAETQCDAFAKWMNYTLKPTEEISHENDFQKYVELGGTSDRVALRSLLLHRRQAQARRKSQELYNSAAMMSIRVAIKSAVDKGHLAIREDRDMHADLGSRDVVVELLLSYTAPWLQLGLETVFDEVIDIGPQSFLARLSSHQSSEYSQGSDVKFFSVRRKAALKQFLVERVLSDPAIRKKYNAGRCKVPSGVFGKRYAAELRAHSLLHILLLVAFLDLCKKENILDTVPRLFTKTAVVKSSCALLVNFCRDFMFGEANIIKHLSRLGLIVTYKQKLIDEYDFGVTNLASDIRDGVRLARLVEILQADDVHSLSEKMRLPAVSRLQKLHNVEIVLRALSDVSGLTIGNIRAKHIVDAHRDKVLSLLWCIVAHFKLSYLLNADVLRREIVSVLRGCRKRMSRTRPEYSATLGVSGSLKKHQSENLVALLLKWCQVVCIQYGLNIQNFTASFADGKALCYLIHYYHPDILLVGDIRPTFCDLKLNCDPCSIAEYDRLQYKSVFENERFNSSLANSCIEELGGIPPMLPVTDSCNIPEEKCVITAVSYIFCRLIESSTEVRAARIIQGAFRQTRDDTLLKKKRLAARRILRFWSMRKEEYFLSVRRKYGFSVKVIERFFFACIGKARELHEMREKAKCRDFAAALIQGAVRCKFAQLHFEILKFCALEIQRAWRTYLVQKKKTLSLHWCILLQRNLRTVIYQRKFARIRSCIISLQCAYRGRHGGETTQQRSSLIQQIWTERLVLRQHMSAAIIQQAWRCFNCRIFYTYHMIASILIQATIRRIIVMRDFASLRQGIVKLQCEIRGFLVRSTIHHVHVLSCYIQKHWRGFHVRSKFCRMCGGIVYFQAGVRRLLAHHRFQKRLIAVQKSLLMQCMWRGHQARCTYIRILIGSIIVQATIRCYFTARDYEKMRRCVVNLQARLRGLLVRNAKSFEYHVACCIQSFWRGYVVRSALIRFSRCIISVQSAFRVRQALSTTAYLKKIKKNERRKLEAFSLMIQRTWRGSAARGSYIGAVVGCIIVQSVFRRFVARQDYSRLLQAAITFQAALRGLLIRNEFNIQHLSSCRIQYIWRNFQERIFEEKLCRSAILLQSVFLMHQSKCSYKKQLALEGERLKQQTSHVTEIQRLWRGSIARNKYTLFIVGSIIVQSAFRRHSTERVYSSLRRDSIKLQARVRGFAARKASNLAHALSCDIQRMWRGYLVRLSLSVFSVAIISLQSALRRRQAIFDVKRLMQRQVAEKLTLELFALNLQRMWRGSIARNYYLIHIVSSIVIQTSFRRHVSLNFHSTAIKTISCVQSHVRGYLNRRKLNHSIVASLKIQRLWTGYTCRIRLTSQHSAASDVQRMWRGTRSQVHFIILLLSTITLQTWCRGIWHEYRYKLAKKYTLKLQVCMRLLLKRRLHSKRCVAVCCLQRFWRLKMQCLFQKRIALAVQKVNCWLKKQYAITKLAESRLACVFLQRAMRGMLARVCIEKNTASCKIQRMWRGYQVQVNYILMIVAAIQIQSTIRGCTEYNKRQFQCSSAIKIQTWMKGCIARDIFTRQRAQIYAEQVIQQKSVLKIQEAFRSALLHKKIAYNIVLIQCSIRVLIAKLHLLKARRVASFLQGTLQGIRVRKNSSKPVKLAARKIRIATQRAMKEPPMQLGLRTSRALLTLQRSKRMVELMEAVETLETSTRLSKSCCEVFVDAGAPEILYGLIRTCNRSLPHIELLQLVLATLENVSRYPKLLPSLATEDAVDILIDLIQMFRDKEVVLWLSAHLLWMILRHTDKLLVSIYPNFFNAFFLRNQCLSQGLHWFFVRYNKRRLLQLPMKIYDA